MHSYDEVDLTAFRRHVYRSKRLKDYCARNSKDHLGTCADPNVIDVLRKQGFEWEETPRSHYYVHKLYEALAMYAPNKIPAPKSSASLKAGIALARACFVCKKPEDRLEVLKFDPNTIIKITSNPKGSPGLTAMGVTKAASMTRALERGLQTLRKVKAPEPCLAFSRTQFNEKTRLVWGYPYSMTAIEGLVAYNLISKFKGGTGVMCFAETSMMTGARLRAASYHKKWAYSLDASQFDAHISARLIHEAFNIIRTWYDPDEVEPVSGCTVREIFDLIERYFIHTPIVMPDGYLYEGKDHGVPSGSYFTQLVDSIVNVIIGGTISAEFHLDVDKREIFVLGDDLLMWSNHLVDLDRIAAFVNSNLHVLMHGSEKSAVYRFDEVIHFLGRDWESGVPNLNDEAILARMIYPERWREYSKDPAKRRIEAERLILSYAWVYLNGWNIALRALSPNRGPRNGEAVLDCRIFGRRDLNYYDVNPDHLSGLVRFRMKYLGSDKSQDIPHSSLQFML